jgi:hypothetical protein
MNKLRICIVAILLSASLVCTVLAITKTQAQSKCNAVWANIYGECCVRRPDLCNMVPDRCGQVATQSFNNCMKNNGYSGVKPPQNLPPLGPVKGPENPPSKKPPVLTPPVKVSRGPVATPTPSTIYSKPKPSPSRSPKKDDHKD